MDLLTLKERIKESWDRSTCYPPMQKEWSEENPSYGQCAVTALLIQDFYGGEILYNEVNDHFWNVLPDGTEIDLTRQQFKKPVSFNENIVCDREDILYSEVAQQFQTLNRYQRLKETVFEHSEA